MADNTDTGNDFFPRPPPEIVEVSLLLPHWEASALEQAAHRRGLTAGEMARCLLREFIAGRPSGPDQEAAC